MGKFDVFNKFNNAVMVINSKQEVIYSNNVFKRSFNDFDDLEKFSHYFKCFLQSSIIYAFACSNGKFIFPPAALT